MANDYKNYLRCAVYRMLGKLNGLDPKSERCLIIKSQINYYVTIIRDKHLSKRKQREVTNDLVSTDFYDKISGSFF